MLTVMALLVLLVDEPSAPPVGVAPLPRRDGVDVHFLSYDGEDDYRVTAQGQTCETPCTMWLKPGPTRMVAVGAGEVKAQFVVPHSAAQVRVATGGPSWYTPTGAVLVPLGLVMGASLWAFGFACGFQNGGCMAANFVGWPLVGVATTIIGAVLLHLARVKTPAVDANRPEILDALPE